MAFTAGDPGEQSAADRGQSGAVDSATAGSNAGSVGGFGGGNDGGTPTMDPGQMQEAGLNTGYGFQAQSAYNAAHGITSTNPYGSNGFFSRVFGVDPKHISYANTMSPQTRQAIAQNQFSKFANPQNVPGRIGYNPDFPTAEEGKLRSGVQSAGYETMFGPVMSQFAEQSTPDMIARGIMGLLGGPVGLAVGQMGTQEYGLPGQPGFEGFDPNNPRGPQSFLGNALSALTGGVDPTQAAAKAAQAGEQVMDFFTPDQPSPTPATTQLQQVAPNMPDREVYADQRDRENALLSGIFGMGTQNPAPQQTNNLQDYMPVQGVAEQNVKSNPMQDDLGFGSMGQQLYSPEDIYAARTNQFAPYASNERINQYDLRGRPKTIGEFFYDQIQKYENKINQIPSAAQAI